MKASNLNEMIDMLDMQSDSFFTFVNQENGQLVSFTEDDEEYDGENIPAHFIPLPSNWDLNMYEIMENFCHSVEDAEIKHELLHAICGRGAFGRFKTAIRCYKIEEEWYRFQHESLKEIAIEFCNAHKVLYTYSPKSNFS